MTATLGPVQAPSLPLRRLPALWMTLGLLHSAWCSWC
jgi:hypothetical protein